MKVWKAERISLEQTAIYELMLMGTSCFSAVPCEVPGEYEEEQPSPMELFVQEGEDVSFALEVAGGGPPWTYQWQIWDEKHQSWVDLPGFTDPVLSRKDIEKKWDGCRFRCVVTDAEGAQIISREAY